VNLLWSTSATMDLINAISYKLFAVVIAFGAVSAAQFCGDCPFVPIPDRVCATKWIPQYGKATPTAKCDCLREYICCPATCPLLRHGPCVEGSEMSVHGKDCCDCPTVQCVKCPAPKSKEEMNCEQCFVYAQIKNSTTGCPQAVCARKDPPKNPAVKCNSCEREVIELDQCGFAKPVCRKESCACQPAPKCFGSQVLSAEKDSCGCERLTCGCERKCPSIKEPVCDDRGNLHDNWCEFGIAACKLEENLQILKIAPLSSCLGGGYDELRDFGAVWRRFWWYDAALSKSVWPKDETDVLGKPFGACQPNASHCFGRLPENLKQDSTLLLAVDGAGNAYKWKFDAANPTSRAAWRAFHDHAETAAGAVKNGQAWDPEVMRGTRPKTVTQDSFMYRDQFGLKSVILDDDNCDCLSTLSMGSGMCLASQDTRYGPEREFGVDNLNDPGCDTPKPTNSLSLYFAEI